MTRLGAYDLVPGRCPACERHMGAAAECPYCGCDAAHRGVTLFLKSTVVILALGGLLGLCLHERNLRRRPSPPPVTRLTPAAAGVRP